MIEGTTRESIWHYAQSLNQFVMHPITQSDIAKAIKLEFELSDHTADELARQIINGESP